MKTAKDFAKVAGQIVQITDTVKPPDGDPYEQGRKLAVFHLRSAAKILRDIAEDKARKEPQE